MRGNLKKTCEKPVFYFYKNLYQLSIKVAKMNKLANLDEELVAAEAFVSGASAEHAVDDVLWFF
jgi:hypothetical protein